MRQSLDGGNAEVAKDTLIERPVDAGVVSFVVDQGRRGGCNARGDGPNAECPSESYSEGPSAIPSMGETRRGRGSGIESSEHCGVSFAVIEKRKTAERGPESTDRPRTRRDRPRTRRVAGGIGSRECGGNAPGGRPTVLPGSRSSSPKAVAQRPEHRADANDTREATKREKNVDETSKMASQPLRMVAGRELCSLASLEGSMSSRLRGGRQPSRTVEANACLL